MAFVFSHRYESYVEERLRGYYQSLSEKDARRFCALEAARLGRGGVRYIAEVLGCATRTITRGAAELELLPEDPAKGRIRRPGAGRKKKWTPSRNWSGT